MRMAVRGRLDGGRQTFVRETNFTGLADNLGILFRLHYGSRNQVFKLQKTISDVRWRERMPAGQEKKALTREIFTDCERAWDNDSFVLETNFERCLMWRGSEIPHM
jgi:hypothetical protein